ncbi:F208B protein, partial [Polypterus senegalus]|nr:F208B protein [Polypterus senegalus]
MLLHVIVSANEIRRLSIKNIPPSIEELCQLLQNKIGLRGSFILQFEDPEFGNKLCHVRDIKDLPTEQVNLKVLFTPSELVCSDSTLDTGSLPSSCSGESLDWPDPFEIPHFSHYVELQLKEANDAYVKDGSVMVISKSVKCDILDKLADLMSKITAYPSKDQYDSVAKALVEKHPWLRLPGSGKGWHCWVYSLKFKMGNYCQSLSAAGCPEVVISAEFKRIVTTDLLQPFLEGLDGLVPTLLEVYKAAAMSGRKLSLKSILHCHEKDAHGEQLYMIMKGMQVGLLIGHEGVLLDAFQQEVFNVAVVEIRNTMENEKSDSTSSTGETKNAEGEYNSNRAEKQQKGYSDEELKESFGFILCKNETQAKLLCETGLKVGNGSFSTLGDLNKGVYVSKYSDCLQPKPWCHGKSGYIVIFRLVKGKVKAVTENYTNNLTQPVPGYDCHVSENIDTVCSRTSSFQAFECTQDLQPPDVKQNLDVCTNAGKITEEIVSSKCNIIQQNMVDPLGDIAMNHDEEVDFGMDLTERCNSAEDFSNLLVPIVPHAAASSSVPLTKSVKGCSLQNEKSVASVDGSLSASLRSNKIIKKCYQKSNRNLEKSLENAAVREPHSSVSELCQPKKKVKNDCFKLKLKEITTKCGKVFVPHGSKLFENNSNSLKQTKEIENDSNLNLKQQKSIIASEILPRTGDILLDPVIAQHSANDDVEKESGTSEADLRRHGHYQEPKELKSKQRFNGAILNESCCGKRKRPPIHAKHKAPVIDGKLNTLQRKAKHKRKMQSSNITLQCENTILPHNVNILNNSKDAARMSKKQMEVQSKSSERKRRAGAAHPNSQSATGLTSGTEETTDSLYSRDCDINTHLKKQKVIKTTKGSVNNKNRKVEYIKEKVFLKILCSEISFQNCTFNNKIRRSFVNSLLAMIVSTQEVFRELVEQQLTLELSRVLQGLGLSKKPHDPRKLDYRQPLSKKSASKIDTTVDESGDVCHSSDALNLLADLALSSSSRSTNKEENLQKNILPCDCQLKYSKDSYESSSTSEEMNSSAKNCVEESGKNERPLRLYLEDGQHETLLPSPVDIWKEHSYSLPPQMPALISSGITELPQQNTERPCEHDLDGGVACQEDVSFSQSTKEKNLSEKFCQSRIFFKENGKYKVKREWNEAYDFDLDSKYTNETLDKTVCRALHGSWDLNIEETYEEIHLILHVWIGLFYSRPTMRFFQADFNPDEPELPETAIQRSSLKNSNHENEIAQGNLSVIQKSVQETTDKPMNPNASQNEDVSHSDEDQGTIDFNIPKAKNLSPVTNGMEFSEALYKDRSMDILERSESEVQHTNCNINLSEADVSANVACSVSANASQNDEISQMSDKTEYSADYGDVKNFNNNLETFEMNRNEDKKRVFFSDAASSCQSRSKLLMKSKIHTETVHEEEIQNDQDLNATMTLVQSGKLNGELLCTSHSADPLLHKMNNQGFINYVSEANKEDNFTECGQETENTSDNLTLNNPQDTIPQNMSDNIFIETHDRQTNLGDVLSNLELKATSLCSIDDSEGPSCSGLHKLGNKHSCSDAECKLISTPDIPEMNGLCSYTHNISLLSPSNESCQKCESLVVEDKSINAVDCVSQNKSVSKSPTKPVEIADKDALIVSSIEEKQESASLISFQIVKDRENAGADIKLQRDSWPFAKYFEYIKDQNVYNDKHNLTQEALNMEYLHFSDCLKRILKNSKDCVPSKRSLYGNKTSFLRRSSWRKYTNSFSDTPSELDDDSNNSSATYLSPSQTLQITVNVSRKSEIDENNKSIKSFNSPEFPLKKRPIDEDIKGEREFCNMDTERMDSHSPFIKKLSPGIKLHEPVFYMYPPRQHNYVKFKNSSKGYPGSLKKIIDSLCNSLHHNFNNVLNESLKNNLRFFILETKTDVFFENMKEVLKNAGLYEIQIDFFDQLDQCLLFPIIIIIRNEDISTYVHTIPHLLKLKKTPNVSFSGVDSVDDVLNFNSQELFIRGGFLVCDGELFRSLRLEHLKEIFYILDELNKKEKWKWLFHYRDQKILKENGRNNSTDHAKKYFMDFCQEAGIVDVLPYHDCDLISQDRPMYLECMQRLQVQYIASRLAVFLTELQKVQTL